MAHLNVKMYIQEAEYLANRRVQILSNSVLRSFEIYSLRGGPLLLRTAGGKNFVLQLHGLCALKLVLWSPLKELRLQILASALELIKWVSMSISSKCI